MTEAAPAVDNARPTVWRRWQLWLGLVTIAIAAMTLRGRVPSLTAIGAALRTADLRWVWAAAAAEAASMAMFARQQRAILSALDVTMSLPRAIAVTYARSAIAISMPAGSAVSAGFAFQQYRRSGATRDRAAATMVLSGLISFFGLAALYIIGGLAFIVFEPSATWNGHAGLILTVAAGLLTGAVIAVAAWRRGRSHSGTGRAARRPSLGVSTATASVGTMPRTKSARVAVGATNAPRMATVAVNVTSTPRMATAAVNAPGVSTAMAAATGSPATGASRVALADRSNVTKPDTVAVNPPAGGPIARRLAAIRDAASHSVTAWRMLRPRHWLAAGSFAVANWLLDLLCLAASARAFNLPVGIVGLAGIYVGVQLVRQIPLTPGGIGLIETGLLAGLAAVQAPAAHAAAAVLTYRVLSCWLIIPIGGLAALGLRRHAAKPS